MTAIKLNKTQRALLEKATRNHRGSVAIVRGFQTGAKGSYGNRATAALRQLRDMGLVGPIQTSTGREYYGNGECDHYTEAWATITEAGRESLR
jgi:hypothetical protein